MRFSLSTLLIAALTITSTHAATSITQLLSNSYIVDITTVDMNTNTLMQSWRQYQSINVDSNKVQTTIVTKQWDMQPFNQTINYEQAQLSGTGGSAMESPIYDYSATSFATSFNGARTWTSCNYAAVATRNPDYCAELVATSQETMTCGRDMTQKCTIAEVVCRHNNVIQPSTFYLIDTTTQAVVASMDSKNATQVSFWSNLIEKPTSGQFGDAVLLPARASCPDSNDKFPAAFGAAPVFSSSTSTPPPATTSSSTGPFNTRSSSTGAIQFGAASASIPALSAIIMLLPAVVTAFLRV